MLRPRAAEWTSSTLGSAGATRVTPTARFSSTELKVLSSDGASYRDERGEDRTPQPIQRAGGSPHDSAPRA